MSALGIATATGALAFDLQGHRGARGLAPENTLAAFKRALEIGVHTLELDTGITSDGVVVVMHDSKLNPNLTRDAEGRWLVAPTAALNTLAFDALRRYDVGRLQPGTRYAQGFAEQQASDGERIPSLAQLFEMVRARGDTQVRFNIETKLDPREPGLTAEPEAFVAALLEVVRHHGMQERVSLQSFDWRTLRAAQKLAPAIPRVALSARQSWLDNIADPRWTAGLTLAEHGGSLPRLVKAAGAQIWSPFHGELSAENLAEARALGLTVVVWTVNEPAQIERMLELGVDGIISDYPDRVRRAMQARGLALPGAR